MKNEATYSLVPEIDIEKYIKYNDIHDNPVDLLLFESYWIIKTDVEKFLMETRNYAHYRFDPYPDTNFYVLHSNASEYIKFIKENNTSDEELMYIYNYICKTW